MPGNKGKNKSARTKERDKTEPWFDRKVAKNKVRAKIARKARRTNRRKR